MSDLKLDVGLANEIKMAARRAGATSSDLKKLVTGDMFAHILPVLRGYAEVTTVRRLSELKRGTALPARTEKFVPKMFFKKNGVWTSSNFESVVLAHAKKVTSMPETQVAFCDLGQSANDAEIQAELPENHIFDDVDLFLPFLAGLIRRQQSGNVGDPLNNSCTNIFYVRVDNEVFAVHVLWLSSFSGWNCFVYRLVGNRWDAGCRVFSANAVV